VDRAFQELYSASYRPILRAVLVLAPTSEDAHDLVQEAFARALARWPEVSRMDNPGGWVRHVAVNAAIDQSRSARSRVRAYRRAGGRGAEPVSEPDAVSVDVVRALQKLKPAHRQALVLHYLLDMAVAEIAEHTGQPVGTVKTNLARGRTALSRQLGSRGELVRDA
jgi:RNA polymerase sigma-70 factor (ECF subfamily)